MVSSVFRIKKAPFAVMTSGPSSVLDPVDHLAAGNDDNAVLFGDAGVCVFLADAARADHLFPSDVAGTVVANRLLCAADAAARLDFFLDRRRVAREGELDLGSADVDDPKRDSGADALLVRDGCNR